MQQQNKDKAGKDKAGQALDANRQRSHEHSGGGHGGQHSGGMGGERGGDLHDAGSGQSGMTGRGGMGGNEAGFPGEHQSARQDQQGGDTGKPDDDLIGRDEPAEVQQSAQREGMGGHRHSGRGNEQALDAASDVDDLGTHGSGAGKSRS